MSQNVIQVDKLCKRYRLGVGGRRGGYKTIRESLISAVSAPFRKSADNGKSQFWVLKDVSFTVEQGEIVGIIGRNGAGKSTLLKILSRITDPTDGTVTIDGRVGSLLEVGTGFHPELTGRENIFLNGAILGMKKAEVAAKFDEIVAFAETEKFLDTPVKFYSSGMYMRLAFAVAAHLESEILVVDEVLAVGDAAFQKRCLGKIGEVAKSGRTVLFVSHNMNAVEQLCSTAVVLRGGQVVERGNDVRSIVGRYMFGADADATTARWTNAGEAPTNAWMTPISMNVTDGNGNAKSLPVRNDEEFWVEIEADINQADPAMNIGYSLSYENGTQLYWTLTTDAAEDRWPKIETGRIRLRSRIPPRWLNEGDYRIELMASLHHRAWLYQPGVSSPSIIVRIQGGLSDSPYYTTRRDGVLSPILDWELMK